MLRKLEYWASLSDGDRTALLALPHTLKAVEPHQYLVRDMDDVTHTCLLLGGFAYRHKIIAGGGRQIFSIHIAGDMVDLQNSIVGRADHNVQALTACSVAFIPREAITKIAFDRPEIGMAMWYDTIVDAAIFREWIANVGRRDAKARVAHLLCEFALRLEAAGVGTQSEYKLPMTQEQLADCTGLTTVHVNRTLKALGREGLIARAHRGVTIADWKKLAAAGDFDGSYLHLPGERVAAEKLMATRGAQERTRPTAADRRQIATTLSYVRERPRGR
jgi:CRP-like cAMP-binding protein